MKSVVVTGGSGTAGQAAIRALLDRGYEILNPDVALSAEPICHFLKTDLSYLGQVIDAFCLAPGTADRLRNIAALDAPDGRIGPDPLTASF